jgi:hypothetical protein
VREWSELWEEGRRGKEDGNGELGERRERKGEQCGEEKAGVGVGGRVP